MKERLRLVVSVGLMILASKSAMGANYAKEMRKAFQAAFRADFSKYQFFGTPVSNFGTGTMYPKLTSTNAVDVASSGLYGNPETWWVRSYSDSEREQMLDALRPRGDAGAVSFQLDTSKQFDLTAVLPGLYKVLTANGDLSFSKKVKVALSADTMENRRLDWTTFSDDLRQHLIKDSVLRHIGAKDYLITIGDVVLYNYRASLVIVGNLSTTEKAQLQTAWKAFSQGSELSVSFSSGENGQFSITSKDPVVVAVYVGEPPPGAMREGGRRPVITAQLSQIALRTIALNPRKVLQNKQ